MANYGKISMASFLCSLFHGAKNDEC